YILALSCDFLIVLGDVLDWLAVVHLDPGLLGELDQRRLGRVGRRVLAGVDVERPVRKVERARLGRLAPHPVLVRRRGRLVPPDSARGEKRAKAHRARASERGASSDPALRQAAQKCNVEEFGQLALCGHRLPLTCLVDPSDGPSAWVGPCPPPGSRTCAQASGNDSSGAVGGTLVL